MIGRAHFHQIARPRLAMGDKHGSQELELRAWIADHMIDVILDDILAILLAAVDLGAKSLQLFFHMIELHLSHRLPDFEVLVDHFLESLANLLLVFGRGATESTGELMRLLIQLVVLRQ